jgi:hypothetical protein
MTPAHFAHELAISAIDLTRNCTEHELYLAWLQRHTATLNGSAGIAHYLFLAATAFEEQAHPQYGRHFDAYVARENFADILMASLPLSSDELRAAVSTAIHEASEEDDSREQQVAARCLASTPQNGTLEAGR